MEIPALTPFLGVNGPTRLLLGTLCTEIKIAIMASMGVVRAADFRGTAIAMACSGTMCQLETMPTTALQWLQHRTWPPPIVALILKWIFSMPKHEKSIKNLPALAFALKWAIWVTEMNTCKRLSANSDCE